MSKQERLTELYAELGRLYVLKKIANKEGRRGHFTQSVKYIDDVLIKIAAISTETDTVPVEEVKKVIKIEE